MLETPKNGLPTRVRKRHTRLPHQRGEYPHRRTTPCGRLTSRQLRIFLEPGENDLVQLFITAHHSPFLADTAPARPRA